MCVRFNNLFYVSLLEKFAQIKNNKKKRNAETIKGKKKEKKKENAIWMAPHHTMKRKTKANLIVKTDIF